MNCSGAVHLLKIPLIPLPTPGHVFQTVQHASHKKKPLWKMPRNYELWRCTLWVSCCNPPLVRDLELWTPIRASRTSRSSGNHSKSSRRGVMSHPTRFYSVPSPFTAVARVIYSRVANPLIFPLGDESLSPWFLPVDWQVLIPSCHPVIIFLWTTCKKQNTCIKCIWIECRKVIF